MMVTSLRLRWRRSSVAARPASAAGSVRCAARALELAAGFVSHPKRMVGRGRSGVRRRCVYGDCTVIRTDRSPSPIPWLDPRRRSRCAKFDRGPAGSAVLDGTRDAESNATVMSRLDPVLVDAKAAGLEVVRAQTFIPAWGSAAQQPADRGGAKWHPARSRRPAYLPSILL